MTYLSPDARHCTTKLREPYGRSDHRLVERLRRLRRSPVVGIAVAALTLPAAGCGGGGEEAQDACGDPNPAPQAETALMPAGLSFDQIGTVTRVTKDERHVTVGAVSTKPLDELPVLIQDAVTAAGYRPAGMDSEEDEAEVFFTLGSLAGGQARVRESDCEGRWDIELVLLDRDVAP